MALLCPQEICDIAVAHAIEGEFLMQVKLRKLAAYGDWVMGAAPSHTIASRSRWRLPSVTPYTPHRPRSWRR